MLLFRLPPRGLDVELRTVRDLGFVEPASALMFEGERGRRGDTAMIVYVRKRYGNTVFGNNDREILARSQSNQRWQDMLLSLR